MKNRLKPKHVNSTFTYGVKSGEVDNMNEIMQNAAQNDYVKRMAEIQDKQSKIKIKKYHSGRPNKSYNFRIKALDEYKKQKESLGQPFKAKVREKSVLLGRKSPKKTIDHSQLWSDKGSVRSQ